MGILSIDIAVFFIVGLLLYVYLQISKRKHWFDNPDESRKLHKRAIPTSAGLVFMLPVLIALLVFPILNSVNSLAIALLLLSLMVMGGIDDFSPISVKIRLLVVFVVSFSLLYLFFNDAEVNFLLLGIYLLGLIWWLNLYNFMDGADGMAALHAVVTGLGYLFAFALFGSGLIGEMLLIILFIVCLLAFVLFNFPKAKMFMGDSGSLSVAFILAILALSGLQINIFDEVLIISFHLMFIIDATLTLLTRIKFKHNLAQAHSLHYFQALIRSGYSHASVSILYAAITLLLVSIALCLQYFAVNLRLRVLVLVLESLLIGFFWFNFHNKTKFNQFLTVK